MENLTVVAKICHMPKIVVVPLVNIYKLDLAKSLNNRINRNQTHLLFWSNDRTKVPNFHLPIEFNRFDPAVDACFNVKLLKVFDNCELALQYKSSRRKIDPAVYNRKRLNEKPFPATQKKQPSTRGSIQPKQNKQQSNRALQSNIITIDCSNRTLDTPPSSPMNVVDENEPNSETDVDTDTNPTIRSDLSASDTSSQDVICLSDLTNIDRHRPITNFDVISGRHTFMHTPKGDRVYKVNGYRFKLNKDTVDRLVYYNKSPTANNSSKIDKTFTELLLLSVFSVSDLKQKEIDVGLLSVIKDFYKNRVGRDKERLSNFEKFVNKKCLELD